VNEAHLERTRYLEKSRRRRAATGGHPWLTMFVLLLLVGTLAPAAAIAWYEYEHSGRVFRGVSALGVDLSGMTEAEAQQVLADRAGDLTARPTVVRAGELEWSTDWGQLGLHVPTGPVASRAMAIGREGNPIRRVRAQLDALRFGSTIPASESFDDGVLRAFVARVAAQIDRPMRNARLDMNDDLTFTLTTAQVGRSLDADQALKRLRDAADRGDARVDLPVVVTPPVTTDDMRLPAKEKAERLIAAPLTLTFKERSWTLEREELAEALRFGGGPGVPIEVRLEPELLMPRLTAIATELAQEPQDGQLEWANGRVRAVVPSREGRRLDVTAAMQMILDSAQGDRRTVTLPAAVVKPTIDTENLAQLGIRELVESASTSFAGAVPQKQHNVRLAGSRLNGKIVPPHATFSFNKALGPTTLDNGFQTAFGITSDASGARTVPSVAGGICQVATTLFQPVFWSGYQIEERHWHLYWIPAYASKGIPGLDATVDEEAGLDLQFTNNTDTFLLIQARTDDTNLTFELYGTKPSWEVKVDGPEITDRRPADETAVTEPEPSLPEGQRYQVEAAREGFKAKFVRTVTAGDSVRTLRLESDYAPSRNVTLVGTGGRQPAPRGAAAELNRPAGR
jgi:vancomycin resistance protein YoaR